MKKIKVALLMIVAIMFILPSCKKGENDPFISLKTRKARLVGEWNLKDGKRTETSSSGSTNYTYSGTTCTETDQSGSQTFPYTQKLTIEKDGTFELELNEDGDIASFKGAWVFGPGNKDLELKDKETVICFIKSYTSSSGTSTLSGTNILTQPIIWQIDMLKNKEMVVKIDGSTTSTGSSSSTSSQTGEFTYEQ